MFHSKCALLLVAFAALLSTPVLAANLVTNPGFETGDLFGWTFTPASCGSDFYIGSPAHSGSYAANFGGVCTGYYDTISQAIATTLGADYTFSFWVYSNGSSSDQQAWWDGNLVLDLLNTGLGWTQYSFTEMATGASTAIAFAGYNVPSWNGIDDVSVEASVPEPATWFLALGGILGALALRKRR